MSISKLHNLESLDIRDTLIYELPKEINMLTNLRYLLAYSYNDYGTQNPVDFVRGVVMQEGFGQLEDLQTLVVVEADIGGVSVMKELEKLKNLRLFGISKVRREICRALCSSIKKMEHLKEIYIQSIDENEVLDLQYISSPPRFLGELTVFGRLEKMPEWIPKLQSLSGLRLSSSRLIDQPTKRLKDLTSLEIFILEDHAYEGEQLHFEEGGFPKLKRLVLSKLDRLKAVKIDRGALPLLEQLTISRCPFLEEVSSIQHLKNLKYATVNGRLVS